MKSISYFKTNISIDILPKKDFRKILIVGSGNGIEAYAFRDIFPNANIIGIDPTIINDYHDGNISFLKTDATKMPFENDTFDLVYSYHVLEHIENYSSALSEMNRVLQREGILFIGTPNRIRLFGYISGDGTFLEKIKWNFNDWKYKLKGKFRNEYGAHAGFANYELKKILCVYFNDVREKFKDYYKGLYQTKLYLLKIIYFFNLQAYILPAIYFMGKKNSTYHL